MTDFRFRRDYADDDSLCDRVFALLDTWIPVLSTVRRNAQSLRWRWQDCSTPFVHERNGRILSHVGVLELPLVVDGEERVFGGVHAVCTLESERRRGLYGQLMEEVLRHCDARYQSLELCTENPEYYQPFGFRVVPEHRFRIPVSNPKGRDGGFRALDTRSDADLDRIDRLLATRAPVSRVLGVAPESHVFKFNLGASELLYAESLDCLAVMARHGARLVVEDLVAPVLPDLASLLDQLEPGLEEVLLHFSPDALAVAGPEAEPWRYDDTVFMVRGPFAAEGQPLMLPPPARH